MNDTLKMQPPEKVCGTCQSIVQRATDPQKIGVKNFECRRFPPQTVFMGQIVVLYPPVALELPGCDEHKAKGAVNTEVKGQGVPYRGD